MDQLVRMLSDKSDNKTPPLTASAQTMTSAPAALRALRMGVADMAVVPDVVVQRVLQDKVTATLAARDLKVVASLDPHPLLIFTRGDRQPIKVGDLAGRTIMMGRPGSDAQDLMTGLLALMGLYPGQYRVLPDDRPDIMLDRLLRQQVDAVILLDNTVTQATRIALEEGRLHLLEPSKTEIADALRRAPFLVSTPVAVDGIGEVYTLSTRSVLMVQGSLPDELVITLLSRLTAGSPQQIDPVRAGDLLPAPLHKAAESFYRARESLSPDSSSASESSAHVPREP